MSQAAPLRRVLDRSFGGPLGVRSERAVAGERVRLLLIDSEADARAVQAKFAEAGIDLPLDLLALAHAAGYPKSAIQIRRNGASL